MTRPLGSVAASLVAQNTFTDWLEIRGVAEISVSGISDSTITIQRTFDDGSTVKDVEQHTADFESIIQASNQSVKYRVGIKTGDYGSDTVACRISY